MRLTQSGGTVTGEYDAEQGGLTGTVTGRVLKGTWTEVPSRQPPNDAGDFAFTMDDDGCASFTGTWRTASGEVSGTWNGTLTLTSRRDPVDCDKEAKACVAASIAYCHGRYTAMDAGLCIGLLTDCCANHAKCDAAAGDACLRDAPY